MNNYIKQNGYQKVSGNAADMNAYDDTSYVQQNQRQMPIFSQDKMGVG